MIEMADEARDQPQHIHFIGQELPCKLAHQIMLVVEMAGEAGDQSQQPQSGFVCNA